MYFTKAIGPSSVGSQTLLRFIVTYKVYQSCIMVGRVRYLRKKRIIWINRRLSPDEICSACVGHVPRVLSRRRSRSERY